MRSPLVVVTGVGTGVGKTHAAEALLWAWRKHGRVVGFKPVETGVDPQAMAATDDGGRLESASTFHVKHLVGVRLAAPLSPHLAAEREGRVLEPIAWVETIAALRSQADGVVVELAGGLFSPVTAQLLNVDLLRLLEPSKVVVVAYDRLGVLHEVIATSRASAIAFDVLLNTPTHCDASTGTNVTELRRFVGHRILGPMPRGGAEVLADDPAISSLISEVRVARAPS